MLDKQTAIELAEGLGLNTEDKTGLDYADSIEKNCVDYFTFERMALLALEYKLDIEHDNCGVENEITVWGDTWHEVENHNGSLEDKQRAYCQAVAKVLIDIKRGEV